MCYVTILVYHPKELVIGALGVIKPYIYPRSSSCTNNVGLGRHMLIQQISCHITNSAYFIICTSCDVHRCFLLFKNIGTFYNLNIKQHKLSTNDKIISQLCSR